MNRLNIHLNKKKRISGEDRISVLAAMGEKVFSIQDLSTVWMISNRHALRVLLSRYTERGILHRIWRGLYSIVPLKEIDPFFLGQKAIGGYSYVSCETVLFGAGLINQRPLEITFVSDISKRFSLLGHRYRARKMRDDILHDTSGIMEKDGIRVATLERAKKDMNYFIPKKYYDKDK